MSEMLDMYMFFGSLSKIFDLKRDASMLLFIDFKKDKVQ